MRRSILSALIAGTRSIDDWNARCRRSGAIAVRVAIGLHHGDVVLGDVAARILLHAWGLGQHMLPGRTDPIQL